MDWNRYSNFTEAEMCCKHTGRCEMNVGFMDRLQRLRGMYGKPLVVTSGYRDPSHPEEAGRALPGAHAMGRAVDLAIAGPEAFRIIQLAVLNGFTGIGVQQKGASRYLHLDDIQPGTLGFVRPTIWSY